jgi:transposase
MACFSLRCRSSGVHRRESGFHTSMTRLKARAPRAERAYGKLPRNRGKNQTLIASLTLRGSMGASMTIEGATDSEAFEASYVERLLTPTLTEGQVVVLDNLGAHRTQRVRELVEARGADLLFLPSYSPDLNPIEEAFSKIKQIQEGRSTYSRSVGRSHHLSELGGNARRRRGMVRPLRLPATGSITHEHRCISLSTSKPIL